jgi:hypothetical protein
MNGTIDDTLFALTVSELQHRATEAMGRPLKDDELRELRAVIDCNLKYFDAWLTEAVGSWFRH